jgi:plasmid stabilization system protein ParE
MWGDQQVDKYGDLLHNTLRAIELNPEIGKADLPPYRYVRAGQHYVFYKLDSDTISVFRILHSKMDFTRHLK